MPGSGTRAGRPLTTVYSGAPQGEAMESGATSAEDVVATNDLTVTLLPLALQFDKNAEDNL